MQYIVEKLLERINETGETIITMYINEANQSATITDDTGEISDIEYNSKIGVWE